jgi:hypothetical protein
LVPPLLVPEAARPHVGSADVDLCLSVAITAGGTRHYYKSIEEAISPYFEPFESQFRWRKKSGVPGIPLLVDFMAPESEATQLDDGTLRPESEAAAANIGLRPFPLRAGPLVDADAETRLLSGVPLVYREGARADVRLRHAGPVGFLAAKADALDRRNDAKDGYDVSWWCIHARSSPEQVAQAVIDRPTFRDPFFQESVAQLKAAFRAPDYIGPDGYARVVNPDVGPGDETFEQDRNAAWNAVSRVVKILAENLWSESDASTPLREPPRRS